MGIGTAAGVGAIGSIAGGVIGGQAAQGAADTQAQAAEYAANLQSQQASNALNFQKQVYGTTQAQQAPFLQAGTAAIGQLGQQFGTGGPQWNQQFVAPTAATEQNDPGYQFRLQQGEQALQQSAAARGDLLTGGTGKAIEQYGQDYASNEYGNVYNRSLNQYLQNYAQFQQGQSNTYSRLMGQVAAGQGAAGQAANAGQAAAGNVANIDLTSGAQQGAALQNAAAASAAGTIGSANAYTGALSGIGSNLSNAFLLTQLMGQSGYGNFANTQGWQGG